MGTIKLKKFPEIRRKKKIRELETHKRILKEQKKISRKFQNSRKRKHLEKEIGRFGR